MKKYRIWIVFVIISSFCLTNVGAISAKSAMVMDGDTGKTLFSQAADQPALVASTTKIMTGLLAVESGKLAEEVTIMPEMVGVEGSSLYLKVGEVLSLEELLYGMMLHSGNDAAVAVALAISGDLSAFVREMNEKVEELGLENTHFANPHGLDDGENYSTAHDLTRLAAYALKNPVFRQVVSTKTKTIGNRILTNHNKMLWRYHDAMGVKTGYTKEAGRILVSAAQKNGRTLVATTISAPDDWNDHQKLLDDGFAQLTKTFVVTQGAVLGSVPVVGGTVENVDCMAAETFEIGLFANETAEISLCLPRFVYPEVVSGQVAGYGRILVDGVELGRVPLVYGKAVHQNVEPQEEKGLFDFLKLR